MPAKTRKAGKGDGSYVVGKPQAAPKMSGKKNPERLPVTKQSKGGKNRGY